LISPADAEVVDEQSGIAGSPTGVNRAIWAAGTAHTRLRFASNTAAPGCSSTTSGSPIGGINGRNVLEYGWPSARELRYTEPGTSGISFCSMPRIGHPPTESISVARFTFGGATLPNSFVGQYFYGDFCCGWIATSIPRPAVNPLRHGSSSNLVDIKVAMDGSLYYLDAGEHGAVSCALQYTGAAVGCSLRLRKVHGGTAEFDISASLTGTRRGWVESAAAARPATTRSS
jgi:hypothetical protein